MKFAVFVCVSEDRSCSEAFDLSFIRVRGDAALDRLRELRDIPYGDNACQKLHHLLRMAARAVEEVKPIPNLLDRDGILLRAVLEDELLEEKERPLMGDLLPDLYQRFPCILGGELRAIWALAVLDEVLDLENLLEDGRSKDLLLDREGDSEAF